MWQNDTATGVARGTRPLSPLPKNRSAVRVAGYGKKILSRLFSVQNVSSPVFGQVFSFEGFSHMPRSPVDEFA